MNKSLKIFIAYAYKDTKAKDQLMICLHRIKSEGLISIWHDNEILAGDKWRDVISSDLTDSDILLYLVSADSLASRNCNRELSIALKENIRIIPIILENCDWQNHQLSNFEVLPEKGKPITQWDPESKGWQNVINGIRIAIQKIQCQVKPSSDISEIETDAELVFQQANFLMILGQIDPAIKAHSQAIELNPRHAEAYRNRGTAYSNKGDFDNAINDFNTAIQHKPNDPATYYSRGIVYGNKGDFDNAINDFSKAIELKPDFAEAYHNRGIAYLSKAEYDQAIADYNRVIELKPDFAEAYHNRGIAYLSKAEYDQAIADYNRVIELKPDFAEAYHNRGIAYSKKGAYDLAIKDYNTAIKLKPADAEAYRSRGAAYESRGEQDLAVRDYNTAKRLKPDDALEEAETKGFLRSMRLRFDEAISSEPYYRIFAAPMTLVSNTVRTQEPEIHNLLQNPPNVRKGAFGFTGIPEVLPIPEGISGFNFGEGEVILLNNGFLELRCPLSDSVFQWQISAYEMFWESEWLYPYVICEFPVTFLRLVKAIYTAANIDSRFLVQQEYHNLSGFLLVGRHPGNPNFGKFENERRVYESPHPIVSKQAVNPDFKPDRVAYDFVTDVYTGFGLSTALMPALFDEEHKFAL